MVKKGIERLYLGLILLFLYAPIITLMVFSFNDSKSRAKWGGFTLKWYQSMFNDPVIMKSLYYTLAIALLSAIIATAIGTAAAIGIQTMRRRTKETIMNVTYLPVLNADIVTGIAFMLFFIGLGLKLGFNTMLIAHITFNIPFVILSVLPKLKAMDKFTYEAALDLGATSMMAVRKVILPEIAPNIITGFLLAFTLSLDDFVISYFTSGNGVSNLSITIYTMTRRGIKPEINAISTILFMAILILLLVITQRREKTEIKEKY
ncbi:MAG: spermidine/putrescine ABC transporter permease [Clostridiales bacterium]|nr:MAG: spermidine/putrescine ABC transporter permease [Clostridiales bacterium]